MISTTLRKSALRPCVVGQRGVVHDLQQDVEDIGMRLLDLIEQHDAVRMRADGVDQQAALLEADVSGGAPISRATACFSMYSLMS